jgi:OmpA-OmpF porin, OOP family
MKKLNTLVLILVTYYSLGQDNNLIENGSFESIKGKLKGLGGIENSEGWFSPSAAKADIFNNDTKIPEISTSGNKFGKEEPKNGDKYAGIVAFSYGDKVQRSYISKEMKYPMQKGMKYCVSMYVSLAELSKYASNQLAFQFTNKALQQEKGAIIGPSHILHLEKKVISATYGWEKICGTYIAEGGEKFVTIGNFTNNEGTKNEKTGKTTYKGTPAIAAYYYIDDVNISLTDTKKQCDCGGTKDQVSDAFYHKIIMLEDKMDPIQRIEAHTTFFPFGQAQLQEANKATINVVIELMKNNPDYKLELFGHIDSVEQVLSVKRPAFADLAHKRIRSVMEYMIEEGITKERFIATPTDVVEPNEEILAEDDEHLKNAKNRRVMFKVVLEPKK